MGRPGGKSQPVLQHHRAAETYYRVPLRGPVAYLALSGALIGLLWFLAPKVWRHSKAARLASDPTIENLQRAISLEPDRAEYRDMLGRQYMFSLDSYDPQRAVDTLRVAVQLNPGVAEYWMDLATAYDSLGRKKDSVECVNIARSHDPRNPQVAWTTGNIRAEAGDIPSALDAWKQAIEEDPSRELAAIDLGWKLIPDTRLLLDHLIPPDNDSDFGFLSFLAGNQRGEPELVWNRIMARRQPFAPKLASPYFDFLLFKSPADQLKRSRAAKRDWAQMMQLLATVPSPEGATDENPGARPPAAESAGNLINNGGFESAILDFGLDWTWAQTPGVMLTFDPSIVQEGRLSARFNFDGTAKIINVGLEQAVPVEPGHRYRVTSYLRAEGIQGGVGVRMEVGDTHLDLRMPPLAHGHEVSQTSDWVADTFEFTAPAKTALVLVGPARDLRSTTVSTTLAGTFWLDNVTMRDVTGSAEENP